MISTKISIKVKIFPTKFAKRIKEKVTKRVELKSRDSQET